MTGTKTANRAFLEGLGETTYAADQLRDRDRVAMLTSLLVNVRARAIHKIDSSIDAADLTFTDAQWTKIEGQISMAIGSATAEADCGY